LFVSLDSGKGDTLAKYRTAEQARQRSEHEWEYKKRDKNKHWFQTHALAWKFLKGFTLESPLTREIDSYFAKGKVVADALTITTHVREHVTPYFAHTNSARCSQNNSGKAQAHSRLFKNCRCYMAGELEALSPDIIVTQGAHAHTAVKYAIDQGNIVLVRDIRSSSKIYHHAILDIDGKQVLWFHTYHPRNYGKFFQQRKQCWDHWAQIAVEWYRQRR
jgi:uracil-DNA glycosylase